MLPSNWTSYWSITTFSNNGFTKYFLFQTHHKQCEHHLDIPHVLFDYHQEVKSGSEKNLAKLKSKIQKYVEKFGFYTRKGSDVTRYDRQ